MKWVVFLTKKLRLMLLKFTKVAIRNPNKKLSQGIAMGLCVYIHVEAAGNQININWHSKLSFIIYLEVCKLSLISHYRSSITFKNILVFIVMHSKCVNRIVEWLRLWIYKMFNDLRQVLEDFKKDSKIQMLITKFALVLLMNLFLVVVIVFKCMFGL